MEVQRGWIQLNSAYGELSNRGISGRSLGKGLGKQGLTEGVSYIRGRDQGGLATG